MRFVSLPRTDLGVLALASNGTVGAEAVHVNLALQARIGVEVRPAPRVIGKFVDVGLPARRYRAHSRFGDQGLQPLFRARVALVVEFVKFKRLHQVVHVGVCRRDARVVGAIEHVGNNQRGEHADDDEHHHEFNQGEAARSHSKDFHLLHDDGFSGGAHAQFVKRMNHNQSMVTRLAAFIVWALVAGCVVYWSLKLLVRAPSAPAHSVAAVGAPAVSGDLTRLLGAAPVAATPEIALAPQASRFRLHGVMAPKGKPAAGPSRQGVALISVDGKPPRAYALGARIDSSLVLQSVSLRTASIGPADGGSTVNLEVPPMPLPATGKLAAGGGPVPLVPVAPQDLASPRQALPVAVQVPVAASATPAPMSLPPSVIAPRRDANNSR
jgi:general secretion pathway protein C